MARNGQQSRDFGQKSKNISGAFGAVWPPLANPGQPPPFGGVEPKNQSLRKDQSVPPPGQKHFKQMVQSGSSRGFPWIPRVKVFHAPPSPAFFTIPAQSVPKSLCLTHFAPCRVRGDVVFGPAPRVPVRNLVEGGDQGTSPPYPWLLTQVGIQERESQRLKESRKKDFDSANKGRAKIRSKNSRGLLCFATPMK